jgi:hypothetical protein
VTSEIEICGLIMVALMPQKERDKREPANYFGMESELAAIKSDPRTALVEVISRNWPDIEWDGTTGGAQWAVPLMNACADRLEKICDRNRGEAHMLVDEMHLESAQKIMANYRANGSVSMAVRKRAEEVIAKLGPVVAAAKAEVVDAGQSHRIA